MNPKEREETLALRKARKLPWHAPPHLKYEGELSFIVSATCFEHKNVIGKNSSRMTECEVEILQVCEELECSIHAWCILTNHYHILIRTTKIKDVLSCLGKFHGSSSFRWNGEDNMRGRKVWFRCFERPMKSERHFWATMNYIHNNPVKHGYVERWHDWPFTSARQFIEKYGREKTLEIWKEYPVLDYGEGWDD